MEDFTQRGEQGVILRELAGEPGKFLDIGAHDGVTFSTTRALALSGWSGVLVEPASTVFPKLMENYRGELDRFELVNAAVGKAFVPLARFWQTPDMVSTFAEEVKDTWAETVPYTASLAPILSAKMLLAALPGPYRFVNVDAEGMTLEVVQALVDAGGFRGAVLTCVEFDGDKDAIRRTLGPIGFYQIEETAENLLLKRGG